MMDSHWKDDMRTLLLTLTILLAGCGGGDYPEDTDTARTNPPNCTADPKSCI